MNKNLITALICCSLLGASAGAADIVATASNDVALKTFVKAVQAAGLTDNLRKSGPYTVFAPDNNAFARLPSGTLEALMKDKTRLSQTLTYHIIPGKKLVTQIKPGKIKSLQGSNLTLTSDNGMVTVNGADVIQSDLAADNGIIQVIDHVLMPIAPSAPETSASASTPK